MPDLAIHDAVLDGERLHVVVSGDRVEALVPATAPAPGADHIIDGGGGALLPGLHDHHIHLLALAAARRSVLVGPPAITDAGDLVATLRSVSGHGWVRGVGYHESVAGDLDRRRLDDALATRPVRLQHRSGAMWILNTKALAAVGAENASVAGIERDARGRPTGRLYGVDAWLREMIPPEALDLAAVGRELASYGVTGVTDATPTERHDDLEVLARAHDHGELPQRIVVTGGPALAADGVALERGPVKLVVADHRLPALDELAAAISGAHRAGRPVAVHCVTRPALLLALAAWDDAGPTEGDRVEHGSVIPVDQIRRIAQLGLTVVTQPNFVAERGDDYLADVEPDEVEDLYRCASLRAGGVDVAGGTDAPYGHPDPWRAMAAAVDRRTPRGHVLGGAERLDPARALGLFLGPPDAPGRRPRRIAVGGPADLCLLDRPLGTALAEPSSSAVRLTVCSGRIAAGDGRR
jgi:predicted amidohydrolase YtcJ